jgi:hypothetical protein
MDRKNMELAASLLAKALRTDFDGEAIALVEKSYSLLAKVITAYDDSLGPAPTGARRRERRLLRDRRATEAPRPLRDIRSQGRPCRRLSTAGPEFAASRQRAHRLRCATN